MIQFENPKAHATTTQPQRSPYMESVTRSGFMFKTTICVSWINAPLTIIIAIIVAKSLNGIVRMSSMGRTKMFKSVMRAPMMMYAGIPPVT